MWQTCPSSLPDAQQMKRRRIKSARIAIARATAAANSWDLNGSRPGRKPEFGRKSRHAKRIKRHQTDSPRSDRVSCEFLARSRRTVAISQRNEKEAEQKCIRRRKRKGLMCAEYKKTTTWGAHSGSLYSCPFTRR